jgi:hypothetical protein
MQDDLRRRTADDRWSAEMVNVDNATPEWVAGPARNGRRIPRAAITLSAIQLFLFAASTALLPSLVVLPLMIEAVGVAVWFVALGLTLSAVADDSARRAAVICLGMLVVPGACLGIVWLIHR